MLLMVSCPQCDETIAVPVWDKDYERWRGGELIQNVFPHWTPAERERLITGTCQECWNKMWEGMEDEDG